MARGLSPLQQQILRLAWERDTARHGPYCLLFPHDIFARLYGWPVTHGTTDPDRQDGLALGAAWHFQPSVIGPERYHRAMVVVSRALKRLDARGLLVPIRWDCGGWFVHGWGLTDEGLATAQQFMVDTVTKEEKNGTENQPLSPLND
jgi:hypothetical protein